MNLRMGRGRFLMWLVMELIAEWPLTLKVYHKKQSILFVETILPIFASTLIPGTLCTPVIPIETNAGQLRACDGFFRFVE
jgi:hypothetical protein